MRNSIRQHLLAWVIAAVAILMFTVPVAQAVLIPGAALQAVLDGITTNPAGDSSVDVTTDYILDLDDSYWSTTASGSSVTTMIIEIAAFKDINTFGVYDMADPGNKVQIFAGTQSAGDQAALTITSDGSVKLNFGDTGVDFAGNAFGYYLDSSKKADGTANPTGGFWYSDTSLNNDDFDHLFTYQGTNTDTVQLPGLAAGLWTNNEYILAWEDLDGDVSDWDFTDMVLMVESVKPVTEPGTLFLLGAGLAGLGLLSRKKFRIGKES